MAIVEGTLGDFLRRIGTLLNDLDLALGTDGLIGVDRGTRYINDAQERLMMKLRDAHANPGLLARKVTITANAVDDETYDLPARTIGVVRVEDSNDTVYDPIYSRGRVDEVGYAIERRQSTTGNATIPVVAFYNTEPLSSATVYAWIIESPVRLSAGDADYDTTTVTFDADPTLAGILVAEDDYYTGSEVAVIASDTAAAIGQKRLISDYVSATRVATVAAWTDVPADNDDYAIICSLPRTLWPCITYDAACEITRSDRRWDDDRSFLRAERDRSFERAVRAMQDIAVSANFPCKQEVTYLH